MLTTAPIKDPRSRSKPISLIQPKTSAVLQEEGLREDKARQTKDYSKIFLLFPFLFAIFKLTKRRKESSGRKYSF